MLCWKNAQNKMDREETKAPKILSNRTNKGISLSKEGEDFLYTRQVLAQASVLEDRYKSGGGTVNQKSSGGMRIPPHG